MRLSSADLRVAGFACGGVGIVSLGRMTKSTVLAVAVSGGLLAALGSPAAVSAADPHKPLPPFQEVYDQLRTNLPGVSEADLEKAALEGLVDKLRGRLQIPGLATASTSNTAAIVRSRVFDGQFAYLRVGLVGPELPARLADAIRSLGSNAPVRGLVLDLRNASGGDYAAAAATADRFLAVEQALLQWPGGEARSTTKTNSIGIPVTALVNGETREAAEALAGLVRDCRIGLVLGSETAGRARAFKELKFSGGQSAFVADQPVKLGSGHPMDGPLVPDIAVAVSKEFEALWIDDPYRRLGAAATARSRRRVNEADLVRMQRDGAELEDEADVPVPAAGGPTPKTSEPEKQVVQDPVLARALDLLRAIQIVKPRR